MIALLILAFVLSVATSFLMSGMEAGVFALNRLRIRRLMRGGNRRAALLNDYFEHPEHFLWTILVGNATANFVAVSIGFLVLAQWFLHRPLLFWIMFAGGGVLFYTLLELLPKTLFRHRPNRLCLALVPVFGAVSLVLGPLVALMSLLAQAILRWSGGRKFTGQLFGTRDELRQVMQESAQALTSEERAMINRVLDLQNLSVHHLDVPLDRAITVSIDTPIEQVLALARAHGLTRLPVWTEEQGRRRIAGLVSLRTLLYRADLDLTRRAGDFLTPALFLDENLRVEAAMRQMQRTGQRLAVVLNGERRETGLLSLEDILKVIFGEVKL